MTKLEKLKQFLESEGYERTYEGLEYDINSEPCDVVEYHAVGIEVRVTSGEKK